MDDEQTVPQEAERGGEKKPNSRGKSKMSRDAENSSSMWTFNSNSISSDSISSFLRRFWPLDFLVSQITSGQPSSQQLQRNIKRGWTTLFNTNKLISWFTDHDIMRLEICSQNLYPSSERHHSVPHKPPWGSFQSLYVIQNAIYVNQHYHQKP